MKVGTAIAASTPRMATTIINSMSVKPGARFPLGARCLSMRGAPFPIVWDAMGTDAVGLGSPGMTRAVAGHASPWCVTVPGVDHRVGHWWPLRMVSDAANTALLRCCDMCTSRRDLCGERHPDA